MKRPISERSYIGMNAWDMGFDAHLTILYTGKPMESLTYARITTSIHELKSELNGRPLFVERRNIELFGPNKNIPVLKVTPLTLDLHYLRQELIHRYNLPNPSEYDWNPHITLDMTVPTTLHIPEIIKLSDLGFY